MNFVLFIFKIMVTSQFSTLNGTRLLKPFQDHVHIPPEAPDAISIENLDLDFSDIFGPLPLIPGKSDVNELVYDEPAVIHSRSHSFVGPTTACVNQQLPKLSKLTLHEREDSLELVDEENVIVEESIVQVEGNSEEEKVGLENFELLKLVGQGAFGKVYQVRKTGSLEIFAMKVMRKDKIMEKNHAEYMKAERDILTKIDHPFIVQLRYSFQVIKSSDS